MVHKLVVQKRLNVLCYSLLIARDRRVRASVLSFCNEGKVNEMKMFHCAYLCTASESIGSKDRTYAGGYV